MGFVGKSPTKLIVHDTGPDGSSTSELVIGRDIDVELASRLVAANRGDHVYTIHTYENGERFEHFVSKVIYDQMRQAMDAIPPLPSVEQNIADLKAMIDTAKDDC
jgi:hypothetical protein